MGHLRTTLGAVAASALAITALGSSATAGEDHPPGPTTVLEGLDGPRGVDALGHGMTLVTESDGTFSLVIERHRHGHHGHHGHYGHHHSSGEPKVIELGQVPGGFAPAIAAGRHHTVWILTGAGAPPEEEAAPPATEGYATLYQWRPGWDAPVAFADIAAYQATDPDPYDLEEMPAESNPFGVAALWDGSVLVADAAGNDLLRVKKDGSIETVARLMPRMVEIPAGLPDAGQTIPSEAVATSVTVTKRGWFVGELRGYPATPGTSQVWKITPGATDAVCDPEKPYVGDCRLFSDGLTSVVDLAPARNGVLALSLSKASWLAAEGGAPGSEIGGLYLVRRGKTPVEMVPDQLMLPGGVDTVPGSTYVVGPVFGPGGLYRIG